MDRSDTAGIVVMKIVLAWALSTGEVGRITPVVHVRISRFPTPSAGETMTKRVAMPVLRLGADMLLGPAEFDSVNVPIDARAGSSEPGADRSAAIDQPDVDLPALIRRWHERLGVWARNGRLERAAREALNLPDHHRGLSDFVAKIATGDVRQLPLILPLSWEEMEGCACAYAPERRLILINREWLENAVAEQVCAVLTEQLGHHLDALFNPVDTPGDEGELFLECLRAGECSEDALTLFRKEESRGVAHLHGQTIAIEEAGVGAVCLDLRDLSDPST